MLSKPNSAGLSAEYRQLLRREHERSPDWGSRGFYWAYLVAGIAVIEGCQSILDYGCGKGTLGMSLRRVNGLNVHDYDPGVPQFASRKPDPVDMVVCADVLEHVEREFLDMVCDDLAYLARKILFVVISMREAGQVLPDGRNAHLIIEPEEFWRDHFNARGFKIRRTWQTADVTQFVAMLVPR